MWVLKMKDLLSIVRSPIEPHGNVPSITTGDDDEAAGGADFAGGGTGGFVDETGGGEDELTIGGGVALQGTWTTCRHTSQHQ